MTRRRTAKPWARRLWGVEFTGLKPSEKPRLIGTAWIDLPLRPADSFYHGEPTRALLFTTREAARSWCDMRNANYSKRTDHCMGWRFRPVRVRETVRVVGARAAKREGK